MSEVITLCIDCGRRIRVQAKRCTPCSVFARNKADSIRKRDYATRALKPIETAEQKFAKAMQRATK